MSKEWLGQGIYRVSAKEPEAPKEKPKRNWVKIMAIVLSASCAVSAIQFAGRHALYNAKIMVHIEPQKCPVEHEVLYTVYNGSAAIIMNQHVYFNFQRPGYSTTRKSVLYVDKIVNPGETYQACLAPQYWIDDYERHTDQINYHTMQVSSISFATDFE